MVYERAGVDTQSTLTCSRKLAVPQSPALYTLLENMEKAPEQQ